jgi:hypothetical protein
MSRSKAKSDLEIISAADVRHLEPSVKSEEWMLPDQVGYIRWVFDKFVKAAVEDVDIEADINVGAIRAVKYKSHQRFVQDYLQYSSPYRGLLLFHALGAGKSCASIAAAEMLIKHDKQVIVMLPASLEVNYVGELQKCGSPSYSPQQRWRFAPKSDFTTISAKTPLWIHKLLSLRTCKGLWIPAPINTTGISSEYRSFDTLNAEDQKAIITQINAAIHSRYTFIHYNGLSKVVMEKYRNQSHVNPFDNKVIIIDEVHNFISQVYNGEGKVPKSNARILYERLMSAVDAKIILLSGTPIINRPFEVAYIINVLKGYNKVYQLELPKNLKVNQLESIYASMASNPRVYRYAMTAQNTLIQVQLVDAHFDKSADGYNVKRRNKAPIDDKVGLASIISSIKVPIKVDPHPKYYLPLPADEPTFNRLFIDKDAVCNEELFMQRSLGAVSAVSIPESGLFPTEKINTIMVPMSDWQCHVYVEARQKERIMEERKGNNENETSVFKSFSRAACLFAFPKGIERQYPMDIRAFLREMDTANEDGTDDVDVDAEVIQSGGGCIKEPCPAGMIVNPATKCCVKETGAIGKALLKAQAKAQPPSPHPSQAQPPTPLLPPSPPSPPSQAQAQSQQVPISGKEHGKQTFKAVALSKYEAHIKLALDLVRQKANEYLVQDLAIYSPKFATYINNIKNSEGPILSYSQYRNVEGLQMLGMVLDAHGFAELRVKKELGWHLIIAPADVHKPKYIKFTGNKEETEVLLAIYNSDFRKIPGTIATQLRQLYGADANNLYGQLIKVLMITQSGAEGISLKNVRQVHIFEPYWNQNRIKQVIGRASRMYSHIALPVEKRHVDVFIYVSQLTPKLLEKNITLRRKDNSLTSDQHILQVAERKDRLISEFLKMLKQSSVDCQINNRALPAAHKVKCYTYPPGLPSGFAGAWDVEAEISQVIHDEVHPLKINLRREGVVYTYLYVPKTRELFDWDDYENHGVLTGVGYLRKKDVDWYNLSLMRAKSTPSEPRKSHSSPSKSRSSSSESRSSLSESRSSPSEARSSPSKSRSSPSKSRSSPSESCEKFWAHLENNKNSCYMHSLFVALFHKRGSWIERQVLKPVSNNSAKAVQDQLQKVIKGMHEESVATTCEDLRMVLHAGDNEEEEEDRWIDKPLSPMDILTKLEQLNIIKSDNVERTVEVYGQINKTSPLVLTSRRTEVAEIVIDITSDSLKESGKVPLKVDEFVKKNKMVTAANLVGTGGVTYNYVTTVIKHLSAPMLIVHVHRRVLGRVTKLTVPVIPSEVIMLKKNTVPLSLSSIIIHKGNDITGHYTCFYKCANDWYYFDDIKPESVKFIGSYEQLISIKGLFGSATEFVYV